MDAPVATVGTRLGRGGTTMHPFLAQDLVRQFVSEVNRKAEERARHRPARGRHDERVLRKPRHDGE
jgi:hypothetical protein